MLCYKLTYPGDDFEELVQIRHLVKYVRESIKDESIPRDAVTDWIDTGRPLPDNADTCVDFLESVGWTVQILTIY